MDIILVHGYNVKSTKTYGVLPQRLKNLGHRVRDVYLSKYVTLDDDLTLSDVIKAFHHAVKDVYGPQFEKTQFSCITHSTGGLVVRGWITNYYRDRKAALPLTHLIMLAPPNFGSRLATLGKSRLSRLRGFWGNEPGLKILDGLELGSSYQWDLNSQWIADKILNWPHFYSLVITGQWIDKKLWDVLVPATYEKGSDGVIRVSSANLNCQKFLVKFDGTIERARFRGGAFLVTPFTAHSDSEFGVMGSIPKEGPHPVFDAISTFLNISDRRAYQELESELAVKTVKFQRRDQFYDHTKLGRYSQLVFRISDDMGNRLKDYAIELKDVEGRGDQFTPGSLFHKHHNAANGEFFVFYVNYDLIAFNMEGRLGFSVTSTTGSPLVEYEPLEFRATAKEAVNFIRPNESTLVDVVLRRRLNKGVFRLTKNFSEQKIKGKVEKGWID